MPRTPRVLLGVLTLLAVAASVAPTTVSTGDALADFPKIVLWAWERPENLEGLNTRLAGVAFLAGTISLRGDSAILRPRFQPLKVQPGTALMAVVRIESNRDDPPSLSSRQEQEALDHIVTLTQFPGLRAIQVDFDATVSQRRFYHDLLDDMRLRLPHSFPISITALASWCMGDDWIEDLPIAEAVPMLFRMGPDGTSILAALAAGQSFRVPSCTQSVGISTDEPWPDMRWGNRRVYVFNPRVWSADDVQAILREVARKR